MTAQQLKNSILKLAISGKLVPQDPNDEPASVLIEKIRKEKEKLVKEGKIKKEKNPSYIFRASDNMPYEKIGDNEPVCIADEVPFEIPESWEWCRLENLIYLKTGLSYKKENLNKKTDFMIRVLRGGNIINNQVIIKDDDIMISKDFVAEECKLSKNNLITPAVTSKEQIGKVALINETINNTTIGGFVLEIIPLLNNDTLSKMLYLIFNSKYHIDNLKLTTHKSGQAFYNISREKMLQLLVPIPPHAEQGRIITEFTRYEKLIDKYDSLETELNKLNAEFPEKLKKSILQQAIQGKLVEQNSSDEPASVLLEKIRKEKEKLIKEGKIKKDKNESIFYKRDNSYYEKLNGVEKCIDDEIPFEIPESWEWCRLGNIGTMGRGTGIKRNETTKKGYPCVRYGELYTKYSYKFSQTHSFVPKNIFEKSYKISYGDLVYTLTGETKQDIAKTATFIGNGNVAVGGDLAFWKHHYMNSLYLEYFMFSPYCINSKINLSTGDIIVHISVDKISSILIPVPPLQEQQSIVGRIEQLFNILNTKII